MSLAHWDALRLSKAGSDGFLNFDLLPYMAGYRSNIRDQITATSNAGGTIHAFGVKTGKDSFGMDEGKKLSSLSGEPHSILISAQKKGILTALCQSGALIEPGTAAFAAQVKSRKNKDEIAKQIIYSKVDLIFAGGEKYLLPKEVQGRFGKGARKDSVNLIEEAKKLGYFVIYDLRDFKKKMRKAKKILGVFAHDNTYNDEKESVLIQKKLSHYQKSAPSIAQMTEKALLFLKSKNKPFLLIVEEEGTDNFSNKNNPYGFFKAAGRADEAVGVARKFLKDNKNTLILTASDSNASGLTVGEPHYNKKHPPFISTSKSGKPSYKFSVLWSSPHDLYGGVVVKAEGLNASRVKGVLDNTDIYKLMHLTLFGNPLRPLRN